MKNVFRSGRSTILLKIENFNSFHMYKSCTERDRGKKYRFNFTAKHFQPPDLTNAPET